MESARSRRMRATSSPQNTIAPVRTLIRENGAAGVAGVLVMAASIAADRLRRACFAPTLAVSASAGERQHDVQVRAASAALTRRMKRRVSVGWGRPSRPPPPAVALALLGYQGHGPGVAGGDDDPVPPAEGDGGHRRVHALPGSRFLSGLLPQATAVQWVEG